MGGIGCLAVLVLTPALPIAPQWKLLQVQLIPRARREQFFFKVVCDFQAAATVWFVRTEIGLWILTANKE